MWSTFMILLLAFCSTQHTGTADSLTRKKRDAKEDRNFELQTVGNGHLRLETHHLQKKEVITTGAAIVTAAATVISASVGVFQAIGNYNPKIVIAVINNGPHTWEGLNTYFYSGTSNKVVPNYVPKGKGFNFPARKTKGSARGAVGVIALYSPKDDKTIYILFSVPYDRNLFSNWWNVQVRDGKKDADSSIYQSLYKVAMPGDGKRHRFNVGEGYSCNGAMSDSSETTLEVRIEKKLLGDVAAVIASIPDFLNEIGNYNTKISMAIINDGPHEWKKLNTYFYSGTSDMKLPDSVHGGQGFNYAARKTGHTARGAVGVIALYSQKDDKTIHILYSVPYDRNLFSNWWNVQVRGGKKKANSSFYLTLYSVAIRGDGKRHTRYLDYGYSCSGVMSKSSEATLEVRIKKKNNVGK